MALTQQVQAGGGEASPHLETLVKRAAEVVAVSELLSGIFGLPQDSGPATDAQASGRGEAVRLAVAEAGGASMYAIGCGGQGMLEAAAGVCARGA